MEWKNVADVISKVAPAAEGLLATFGGPPGLVAAGAIKAATMAFGLDETAKPDELITAISTDPQAALKLVMANQNYTLEMRGKDIEELKAWLGDRENARGRDVEIIKGGKSNTRANLMLLCAFGAVIVIAVCLASGYVIRGSDIAGFLIAVGGMFARNIGTAFDFEFGSSKGSEIKTDLLARAEAIK